MSDIGRVICVGTDLQLLESRRLVLQARGFEASCHLPGEALKILPGSSAQIMIIARCVSKEDQAALAAAAPDRTRVIQLNGFVGPHDLLALVRS